MQIIKILGSNPNHIEWLDLSRNPFSRESGIVSSLLGVVKSQTRLFHFGLDIQETYSGRVGGLDHKESISQMLRLLNCNKPPITSLALVDTRLSILNMRVLESVL
jgi:hypothetical protein